MALTLTDHKAMMRGVEEAGFSCQQIPGSATNPIRVDFTNDTGSHNFRLWAFDVTHGGGGAEVRAADEFRIQITNGPASEKSFDANGAIDLLVGYSRDRDVIVAYDRRWLQTWTSRKEQTGAGGSPSLQVKEADMQAARETGIHHLTKKAGFGDADVVTMRPSLLPSYLLNHESILKGTMTAEQATGSLPVEADNVFDYCAAQGFPFEPDLIARYVASIATKPFVILAGISGTGKSKLAELVGEFYSMTGQGHGGVTTDPAVGDRYVFNLKTGQPDRTRFALVAVRPDWNDSHAMFGFVNPITNGYESTQALDLLLLADKSLKSSTTEVRSRYFLLLDEMNLARVEHYFSDWLACTETRRYAADGSIVQLPVPLHRSVDPLHTTIPQDNGVPLKIEVPPNLLLPVNVVVTGTVNVDETTHGFSPKVLDRAMVIEFDDVNLDRLRTGASSVSPDGYRFPAEIPAFRLPTSKDYAALPLAAHGHLSSVNQVLSDARLHIGYRAANEIALFMSIYNSMLPEADDPQWLRALDAAIVQKVLPRLTGNRARLEGPLSRLCVYLRDLSDMVGDGETDFAPSAAAGLPRSYRRALEMLDTLRDFGFVSFFK